jgi:hypothetical protein
MSTGWPRLAALVAVDAPTMSYLLNLGTADAGVTLEDVQGVLIAVAPIVGTPRVVSAAARSPMRLASRLPSPKPKS